MPPHDYVELEATCGAGFYCLVVHPLRVMLTLSTRQTNTHQLIPTGNPLPYTRCASHRAKTNTSMIVAVGEQEQENQMISVRRQGQGDLGSFSVSDFVSLFNGELEKENA